MKILARKPQEYFERINFALMEFVLVSLGVWVFFQVPDDVIARVYALVLIIAGTAAAGIFIIVGKNAS